MSGTRPLLFTVALVGILDGCRTATPVTSQVRDVASNDRAAALNGFRNNCGLCHSKFKAANDTVLLNNLKNVSVDIKDKLAWNANESDPADDDGRMPPMADDAYPEGAPNRYKILRDNPSLKLAMLALLDGAAAPSSLPNLPLSDIKLPPNFKIAVFAAVPGARSMALSPQGTLYIGTGGLGSSVKDRVFVIPNAASMPSYSGQPLAITKGVGGAALAQPNGVAFANGSLYVAEWNRIVRYDDIEGHWTSPAAPVNISGSFFNLIKYHEWKYLAFGPDNKLYVGVGSHSNIHAAENPYASIVRLNPDGSNIEVFARGIRNSVGFDWHPSSKELWFTDNGCDQLGPNSPPDELNRAPAMGMHFGFPFCFGKDTFVDRFAAGKTCADSTPPVASLDPHSAALGMKFYTGSMFPAEYENAVFIAEHGSWARAQFNLPPTGFQVVVAKLSGNTLMSSTPFARGWSNYQTGAQEKNWGRPTDVLVMPDGALLVSDSNGVIYRITYEANGS